MNQNPPLTFRPGIIGTLRTANRLIRSATHEGMGNPDGVPTSALAAAWENLARGGIGLIISGHAFVDAAGRASRNQTAIDRDELIPSWRIPVEAVHRAGGKVMLQLAHAGLYAAVPEPAGPSPSAPAPGKPLCREISSRQIIELIAAFARAARRAREAGFDGVQLHAAHGYLISQFLSGYYNHRTDEYGGTPENRSRLLVEILKAVRREVGSDYPVTVKINSEDFITGGMNQAECAVVCRRLQEIGLDAVELSGGVQAPEACFSPVRRVPLSTPETAFYREAAAAIRKKLHIPVILVGGLSSLHLCEELLHDQCCDFIALCRPLIREPALIRRWQQGDDAPSPCIRCNACFRPILTGRGLFCPIAARNA